MVSTAVIARRWTRRLATVGLRYAILLIQTRKRAKPTKRMSGLSARRVSSSPLMADGISNKKNQVREGCESGFLSPGAIIIII